MDLNKILQEEQIAMMQLAASGRDDGTHRSELGRIAGKLSLFVYPHRPYVGRKPGTATKTGARAAALRMSLAGWENEGGAR